MTKRRLGSGSAARLLSAGVLALLVCLAALTPVKAAPLEALAIDPAYIPTNTSPASAIATIRGMGFTPSTTVAFDGVASPAVTFIDSRTLQVQVPTSASGKVARVVLSDGSETDEIVPFIYTGASLFVRLTGSDSANGTSPATAKRTITSALGEVTTANTWLVRVAAGTYVESGLAVFGGVVVSGGWNEAFTQRDPDQLVTVLDANRAGFAIRSAGLDSSQVIDGLTIRNGLREGLGGGGLVISGDNTVLSNSVIVGNTATSRGGGVYATFSTSYGGKPILSRNVFLGNRAWSNAGGGVMIYPFYSQGQVIDIAVTDNFILGNRSFNNRGGGLALSTQAQYNYNVLRLRAVGNVIGSNRAVSGAGLAVASLGSGDHFDLLLDNNLVFGNTAAGDGGGILFSGIGHFAGTLSGTTVTGNTGGVDGGGGIRFSAGPVYEPGFAATNLIVWQNLMNDVSGGSFLTYSTVGGGAAGTGNIAADPQFDSGPMGQFYLSQAAGMTSPAVDAGGGLADEFSMEGQTTDPELAPDAGMVDMGYHYPPDASDSPDPLVIGRVDPPQGDLGGSDWVLIRGTGFDPGAAVFFDSVAATDLIYVSSRRLLAMPPSHAAGAVSVRIANPDASEVTQASAYTYLDNTPPSWQTTTGLQSASSGQDCVRTVTLEWNAAVDTTSPPVRYAVHRELCVTGSGSVTIPCDNFTYTPTAANRVATTTEMFYTDSNFASGGADPKYIYMIRALDSATPFANTEYNYSKRVVLVTKDTSDLTPPPPIGDTVHVPVPTLVDWDGVPDAVSYGLYRRTDPADYGNPGALTPFLTLTSANNDVDMDGVTDTQYVDNDTPAAGTAYFYKITAFDRCGNESRTDL